MNYLNRPIAVVVLTVAFLAAGFRAECAQPDDGFQKSYERWQTAIDSQPALASDPFFFDDAVGSVERQAAIKQLLLYGPAGVPTLVDSMRNETDRQRLYRAVMLLSELAGIDIKYSYRENISDEIFEIRDAFLQQWDSGNYDQPEKHLANAARKFLRGDGSGRSIPPRELLPIRYFGVYAIPFIVNALKAYNSPEMYASFLIITKQRDAYRQYIQDPKAFDMKIEQKMEKIRLWQEDNQEKLERVPVLSAKIRKEIDR